MHETGIFFRYYAPIGTSAEWAEKLLLFQCETPDGVKHFLRTLYKLLDRRENKRNAMLLAGAANSGKTWFVRMISGAMITVGIQKNLSKATGFPFQDCIRRRLIINYLRKTVSQCTVSMFCQI
uniref:Putative NS1 protein n=1 Tax=Soybean thrips denso-like virus 2 TaxID=2803989 RepID=A0A7T8E859_9VIRU|nr:putative NS1 protein [Soybean thrips denso-like virus 2]